MTLASSGFETWLDGMARSVNSIYRSAPEYLADAKRFRRALDGVHVVESPPERRQALRDAEVIVTTGGMLDGGPVLFYLGERYRDANSSILLTGFQVEGSNGRQLLDKGTLTIDEVTIRPECEVLKFDFSAHAGHTQLMDLIRKTEAREVVLMHGDQREKLAEAIAHETKVVLPENGRAFTV
jgi:putative mRNA 3-end processing factor